jgi:hypothetical protein
LYFLLLRFLLFFLLSLWLNISALKEKATLEPFRHRSQFPDPFLDLPLGHLEVFHVAA